MRVTCCYCMRRFALHYLLLGRMKWEGKGAGVHLRGR